MENNSNRREEITISLTDRDFAVLDFLSGEFDQMDTESILRIALYNLHDSQSRIALIRERVALEQESTNEG